MDSQTQLAENNDQVLDEVLDNSSSTVGSSTTPVEESVLEADTRIESDPDAVTDQSIADSIQASLQSESTLQNEPTAITVQSSSERYSAFWNSLVDSWREMSQSGRPLIVSLAWIFAALVALRILAAIIGALNSTPLISPLLQLIGAGYTVWFINRYLLKQTTRQELSEKIKDFTGQTMGRPSETGLSVSVAPTDLALNNPAMLENDPVMLEE